MSSTIVAYREIEVVLHEFTGNSRRTSSIETRDEVTHRPDSATSDLARRRGGAKSDTVCAVGNLVNGTSEKVDCPHPSGIWEGSRMNSTVLPHFPVLERLHFLCHISHSARPTENLIYRKIDLGPQTTHPAGISFLRESASRRE